tara:strand:- start:562 stop:663 length:102 start_codon:yes stop_codon:yes gene_type:complete
MKDLPDRTVRIVEDEIGVLQTKIKKVEGKNGKE